MNSKMHSFDGKSYTLNFTGGSYSITISLESPFFSEEKSPQEFLEICKEIERLFYEKFH